MAPVPVVDNDMRERRATACVRHQVQKQACAIIRLQIWLACRKAAIRDGIHRNAFDGYRRRSQHVRNAGACNKQLPSSATMSSNTRSLCNSISSMYESIMTEVRESSLTFVKLHVRFCHAYNSELSTPVKLCVLTSQRCQFQLTSLAWNRGIDLHHCVKVSCNSIFSVTINKAKRR